MEQPDERPSPRAINAPRVVLALIAVFVLVHVVRTWASPATDLRILLTFGFIPARHAVQELPGFGPWPGGEWAEAWTYVTYAFLHGDWMHLLINAFWMLAFGSVVARRLGWLRFLGLSLAATVGGALAHLYAHWGEMAPMIGASAAISGQMAGAVRFIFARPGDLFQASRLDPRYLRAQSLLQVLKNPRAMLFLGVWIGLNLIIGAGSIRIGMGEGSPVAWEAHLGGFFAGLLLFGLFDRRSEVGRDRG